MHTINLNPHVIELSIQRRGRVQPFTSIEPRKTALLVVDMQVGFMAPGALAEIPQAREIVPAINRLSKTLRDAGGLVVWVVSTYGPDADSNWPSFFRHVVTGDLSKRFRTAFDNGQPEHPVWPDLDQSPKDITFAKNRMTPFADRDNRLEDRLREHGIDTVLVTGTVTSVCCESTARDAAMRGFKTIMVSDANAARSDDEHNASLSVFLQSFGGVLTSDEIITYIGSAK